MRCSILLCVILLGCGEEHSDHHHGSNSALNDAACAHMDDPPVLTLAGENEEEATATNEGMWMHRRHDVTLRSDGGQFVGYLMLGIEKAGVHSLFTDVPVDFTIGGIAAKASEAVDECDTVEGLYVYELPIGEHVMSIRADQDTVALVLEFPGNHDGHDHGGHDH